MGGSEDRTARREAQVAARRAARRSSAVKTRRVRRRLRSRLGAGLVVAVVAVAAFLVVLTMVGGSEGPTGPSSAVTVVGDEFSFDPDLIEGIAGELDVTLINEGKVGHEFVILQEGVRIAAASQFEDSMSLGRMPSIGPDRRLTQTFDLEPGDYQVVCMLPGHLEAGMAAELTVR